MSCDRRTFLAGSIAAVAAAGARRFTTVRDQDDIRINYDESKVPSYTLPDPLVMEDGTPVRDAETWNTKRRPELLKLFQREVYGVTPRMKVYFSAKRLESSREALDGAATRVQWEVCVGRSEAQSDEHVLGRLLLYQPNRAQGRVPAVVALNFGGNHAVTNDPAVPINAGWFRNDPDRGYESNRATENSRGSEASRWPLPRIIERGYAVATMYYGDIDPDFDDGFRNGIHGFLDPPVQADPNRPPDAWGTIAAWALGLTAIFNTLAHASDSGVDPAKIAVMGHSRLGKAALWAAALDRRFALVISNQSGCGGAALSKRVFGETVRRINTSFPHWFCDNFRKYDDNESALPIDQHELLALIAPRPLLVCSAEEDQWADPTGEFLSCLHADPVYRLLGTDGLAAAEMPKPNERISTTLAYHIRPGQHDVLPEDWEVYLDFADKHLAR